MIVRKYKGVNNLTKFNFYLSFYYKIESIIMPIVRVDEGVTKKQIKIMVISALCLLTVGTIYIFRTQTERYFADVLWEKQKLTNVSIKLYSWAASNGNLHSQSQLAHILRGSKANYEDGIEASTWLKMAAEQGDPRSMYYYGVDIIDGKTGGTSLETGIDYIQRALNSGFMPTNQMNSNYILSNAYLKLSESAQKGIYQQGDKNLDKAREFAEKSYLNKDYNSIGLLLSIYELSQPPVGITEEHWLLKILDLQKQKPNSSGAIALNYAKLYKITNNQDYYNKYVEFAKKAAADPLDVNFKKFTQQKEAQPVNIVRPADLEPGDDPNATEGMLLSIINSLNSLQARGSHQNGLIAKNYYRLYKLTKKEEYKVKMLEYGNAAIKDPDDTNTLYVKKWILY